MKKLVKCLLASGLLVGMLAACSPKKDSSCDPTSDQPASSEAPSSSSSSSETPVPPEPQPEPKTEWTRAEELVFAQYEIEVLPFASELSIEDATDGVVLATSKEEVTTDDVDAYVALLEEQVTEDGDNCYVAINDYLIGGNTQDLELLGFDLGTSDVYQYLREFDPSLETDYRFQNLVSVGINEDGLLQVASATVCLPLFSGWEGIIGGGMEAYPLLYESSSGREVNFMTTQYSMVFSAMLAESMEIAANAMPFAPEVIHPEIVKEQTYGVSYNPALQAPYFLSNIYSSYYDQSEFIIWFIDTNDEGIVSYTQEQLDALIETVKASEYVVSFDDEEKVATYDYNGLNVEVGYALSDFDEAGTIKCIELDYVVKGYEMPGTCEGVVGLAGTLMGAEASDFEYWTPSGSTMQYYVADIYAWDATVEQAVQTAIEAFAKLGVTDIEFEYDEDSGLYFAEVELITSDDQTAIEINVLLVDYSASYGVVIIELQGYEITAAEYAQYLFSTYMFGGEQSYGLNFRYFFGSSAFNQYVAPYLNLAYELFNSENITFTTAEETVNAFITLMDEDWGNYILYYANMDLEDAADLVQADYETADWNELTAAVTGLQDAIEDAEESESYMYVLYYAVVLEDILANLETWRDKYQAQLQDAYNAAFGYDETSGEYKYDNDDFDATALAEAMAAVQAFIDVVNTEGATATVGKAKLNEALAKLQALTPDKQTLLDRLTAAFNEYAPADYSDTNWATLEGYFTTARDLIANEETSFDDAKAAYLQALADMDSVEKKASVQLAEWFAENMVEENFKAETWTDFVDVKLPEFQTRLDAAADEDEEIEIFLEATEYFEKYILNTYTQQINAFVDGLDQTQFTDFSEVTSLRDAALASLADVETEAEAQQILDKLEADVNALRS